MESVQTRKHLGQHFLTGFDATQRITSSVVDYLGTSILEMGPGMDVLAQPPLETGHDLQVIDMDHESIEYLHQHFPQLNQEGRVIEGDFLKLPAEELTPGRADMPFVVIGDYPYSISSQIFFRVLELRERILAMAGVLQHEVAQRLCASSGSHDYGILSVLLQCWYDCDYLFKISKRDFSLPPKVDGGVMTVRRNGRTSPPCDKTNFKRVIGTVLG